MKSMRESTGYSCRPWDDMVTFYLFLFPPGCLHGSSTCTELSGHWRLLVLFLLFLIFLATCARLSWSLSFLVLVKLFFRVVSYLTVVFGVTDVRCPAVPDYPHQTVDTYSNKYNTTVTFWCDVGYVLFDNTTARTVKCMADGTWSADLPPCYRV